MHNRLAPIFGLNISFFLCFVAHAGGNTTYDFENIPNGGSSFQSSGQTFTVIPELSGVVFDNYGSDLNGNLGVSDGYSDTGFEMSNSGNVGGINAPAGMTFRAQRIDAWPSENGGGVVQTTGSLVRVLGFRDGNQIVTADVPTIDYGQMTAANVRWHRLDLSATVFATTDIDSLQFELVGNQDYLAIDNFVYSNLQVANNLPTIAGTVANQAVDDDQTILPFEMVTLSDADGDNISLTVSLDDNAKGVFSPASLVASGFTGSGPYTLTASAAAVAQAAIRQLVFDPTDDRVSPGLTETTTFNIASFDGFGTVNDNLSSVVSTSIDQNPVAVADMATVLEDSGTSVIDVLNNDTDVDAGPRSVTAVTQPNNGNATNLNTELSYQPLSDYCNEGSTTDDFTYTINGGSEAEVAVTVGCVNDAPSFTVAGDVNATGLVDAQNTQIQISNFADNIVFGPLNESAQSVLGFFPNCSDPDGIIDFIIFDAQGKLTIDFTLSYGVAACQVTLLDTGGTNNGGENTSAPEFFNVAFTDVIYANGFETINAFFNQLRQSLAANSMNSAALEFDHETYHLYYLGNRLQLSDLLALSSQKVMIEMWLRLFAE